MADRITRLNAQMQKELGQLVERLVRPELPGILITITGVEIASTLRSANVFVSVYGGKNPGPRALEVLNAKRHLFQSIMSRKIILKYTPVLNFKLDDTAERAERVMRILQDLNLPEEEAPREEAPGASSSME